MNGDRKIHSSWNVEKKIFSSQIFFFLDYYRKIYSVTIDFLYIFQE